MYNGVLFILKKEILPYLQRWINQDDIRAKWNKLGLEGQTLNDSAYMKHLK